MVRGKQRDLTLHLPHASALDSARPLQIIPLWPGLAWLPGLSESYVRCSSRTACFCVAVHGAGSPQPSHRIRAPAESHNLLLSISISVLAI